MQVVMQELKVTKMVVIKNLIITYIVSDITLPSEAIYFKYLLNLSFFIQLKLQQDIVK